MSQNANIYAHLADGKTLTPMQALNLFGTLALHSRIAELRERGHAIECTIVKTPMGKRVGRYSLKVAA